MTKKKNFIISGIVFIVVMLCCVFLFFGNKTPVQQDLSIVFTKSGNVSEYKTTGFSSPGPDYSWSNSDIASIEIPLPEIAEDKFFNVSLDAHPFVAKRLKKQTVSVFVNDEFIKDFVMTGSNIYKFDLPHDLQKLGKVATIKFRISNPTSPKSLNLSEDSRKLGMAVKKIVLSECDKNNPDGFAAYNIGDKIVFSSTGNSRSYTTSGWSGPESTHVWTNGTDAYMELFMKDAANKTLQLNVFGSGIFPASEKYQEVTVYVNGTELTKWNVTHALTTYGVKIPEDVVGNGALRIRFHIAKPFIGKTDTRHLGFAVREITLSNRFGAKTKGRVASWLKSKITKSSDTAAEQK